MAARCPGVVGTFQYVTPKCKEQPGDETTYDPHARCKEKGGKLDELADICPKCNDEIVWVRKRIDVSHMYRIVVNNSISWPCMF